MVRVLRPRLAEMKKEVILGGLIGVLALLGLMVFVDHPLSWYLANELVPQFDRVGAFFSGITLLGDSLAYVIVSLLAGIGFALIGYLKKRSTGHNSPAVRWFSQGGFFLFLVLLISGIVVNLLKIMIGRARPRQWFEESITGFYPFNFNAFGDFYAFPSGHSATAFAMAAAIGLLFPRHRSWLYLVAGLVAISRVVLGAHFPSDILAGALLGVGSVYLIRALSLRQSGFRLKLIDGRLLFSDQQTIKADILSWVEGCALRVHHLKTLGGLFLAILLVSLVFILFPGLDKAVSGQFWDEGRFLLQARGMKSPLLKQSIFLSREILNLSMTLFPVLFGLAGIVDRLFLGSLVLKAPVSHYFTLLFTFLLVPGGVINGIFKGLWGRARPESITEFGGSLDFTPAWVISDQCQANCSFVSGEVALPVTYLIFGLIYTSIKKTATTLALFFGLLYGLMRLMQGGHFLSDVLLSGLMTAFLVIVFYEGVKGFCQRRGWVF